MNNKEYILAHKFGEGVLYYVRVNQDSWDETYSPHFASVFQTEQLALEWSKSNTNFGEYAVALETQPEKDKFDEWVKGGMVRRHFELVDKKLSREYNGESPEDVLAWWISIRGNDGTIRNEDYRTWPKIYSVFKHLFDCVSYYSKDNSGPFLHSFSVYTRRDGKFEDFEKELGLVLPHITHLNDDGDKVIDVFDHYLSEGGNSVSLLAHKNGKFSVEGRYEKPVKNTSLKECFEYLKRERYYE